MWGAQPPTPPASRASGRRSVGVREPRHPALGSAVRPAADPAARGSPGAPPAADPGAHGSPARHAVPLPLRALRRARRVARPQALVTPRSPGAPRSLRGRAQLRSGRGRGGAAPTEKKSEGGWVGRAARSACSSGPAKGGGYAPSAQGISTLVETRQCGQPRRAPKRSRCPARPVVRGPSEVEHSSDPAGGVGAQPPQRRSPRAGEWAEPRAARAHPVRRRGRLRAVGAGDQHARRDAAVRAAPARPQALAMPRSPGAPRSLRGRAQLRSGRGRGGAAPTEKKSEGG